MVRARRFQLPPRGPAWRPWACAFLGLLKRLFMSCLSAFACLFASCLSAFACLVARPVPCVCVPPVSEYLLH
jgi:hypothetical protein